MSVRSRWLHELNVARGWAATWRQRYMWDPTAANKAKLLTWRERVAYAQRVLARHPATVTSVSDRGVDLVASFEGFRSKPYQDVVGVWTIGYGETRGVGPHTAPVTRERAKAQLRARLNRDYLAPVLRVAKAAGLELTQNQADALASLVYNLGPGILARGKTMGDALRSKNRHRIAQAFLVYDHAGGRRLPGLTRRRRSERALFLS